MGNNFKNISNIRMFLHANFYNDNKIKQDIFSSIVSNLDLFSINYNSLNNSIELKIKKTNIRKNNSFSHTASYYYNIFIPIFHNIFCGNIQLLNDAFNTNANSYNLDQSCLELMTDINKIELLFNITTLSDNIIIIYL